MDSWNYYSLVSFRLIQNELFKLQCTIIQAHPNFHSSKVPTIGIFLEIAMLKLLTNPRISRYMHPSAVTVSHLMASNACMYPQLLTKINALDI